MLTEGVQADAAIVFGQLITTDIDKTTYNTTNDPETPSLTALEMMRKVPMLTVDGDDNLKLNGQANFKILVNGKSSTLMSSNYKEVLKSMPAGSIKNIEVITNPPAKYDAEGIGGIINIITDRKSIDGFNGSVGAGIRRFGSGNANAYIAAANGKFSVSANYFVGQYMSPSAKQNTYKENFNSDNMKYLNMGGGGNATNLNYGFNIEASYEIDTLNLITLSAGDYFGNASVYGMMENRYLNYFDTGNPNLSPEIGHTVDITYGRYDGVYNLNMRASASVVDNSIETIYNKLENGALLAKPENIGSRQSYRLSANGGVRTIKGKLNFNVGANVGYTIIDANNGTGDHNEGWSTDVYLNISSNPWKDGSVTGYGGYYYGGVGLQEQPTGSYYYGFSIGHWFLKKTFRVTANISNPFTTYQYFTQKTITVCTMEIWKITNASQKSQPIDNK